MHHVRRTALMAFFGSLSMVAQQGASPPVTPQMLLDGLKDPTKWLMFGGDYTSQRHSPLTQLTPQNVDRLTPQWLFQTQTPAPGRGFETMPIVLDGVMYITGNNNHAWALDALTGRQIWHYQKTLPELLRVCCSKVIVGVAGGDYADRGFIDAYDAETGTRAWRFYTVPGAGEKGSESWPNVAVAERGGGGVWTTGAYDPALNLVYYGTGNPNPDYYGDDRNGDNLYTCSLLALDADTGKLRWHYQFTPHDLHDWDSAHVPVQADLTIGGQLRKVIMVANRNGFFYTLDRETGKLLVGKPFIDGSNWAKQIGPDGRPIVLDNIGTPDKCLPDNHGGTNFQPPHL